MNKKESELEIKELLKKLDKEISGLYKKLENDYKPSKKKIKQHISMTQLMIESYTLEFEGKSGQRENVKSFKSEFKYLEKKSKDVISQFREERKRKKDEERGKRKKAGEMQKTELIKYGDELQERGLQKLEAMNKELDEGNDLIDDVNIELRRQGEVLLGVEEDLNDIGSTLKRAQRYISYFSHEYYKDKFIRIMIILIGLLFIIIIVSIIVKKGTSNNNEN